MSGKKETVLFEEHVLLTLDITPQVALKLQQLTVSGFYGHSVEECAERILSEALRGKAT